MIKFLLALILSAEIFVAPALAQTASFAPDPPAGDSSNRIATTSWVQTPTNFTWLGSGVAAALALPINTPGSVCSVGTSGAVCGLLSTANTISGNWQFANGSNSFVNLTSPASNEIAISADGSIYLVAPLTGGTLYSALYMKNTSQFDAAHPEYFLFLDNSFNTGYSPQWVTLTVYGANSYVSNAGSLYFSTSGGTSGASAPTCGSGTCSDGGITWTFSGSTILSAKVGLGISTVTGSTSAYGVWGFANDLVIGSGDNFGFRVGMEHDITTAQNCVPGVRTCYLDYYSGIVGAGQATAMLATGYSASTYPFYYGFFINGGKLASVADYYDSASGVTAMRFAGVFSNAVIDTTDMSGGTFAKLKAGQAFCFSSAIGCVHSTTNGLVEFYVPDSTTSYLELSVTGGTSGYASMIGYSDHATYNWGVGGGTSGAFEFWSGRYAGNAGTKVASLSSTGALNVAVAYLTSASSPTLSSCGTSSSAATGSSNQGGQINFGSGTTSCVATFATAYPNYAFCTISPLAQPASVGTIPYLTSISKTGFTISGGVASASYTYACNGN